MKKIIFIPILLSLVGCSNPEDLRLIEELTNSNKTLQLKHQDEKQLADEYYEEIKKLKTSNKQYELKIIELEEIEKNYSNLIEQNKNNLEQIKDLTDQVSSLSKKDNSFIEKRSGNKILSNSFISCKLKLFTNATEGDTKNEIKVTLGEQENYLNLNFYDLDTKYPYLKSNGGTSYLTPIDQGDVLYLFETTTAGYIASYTYFKKSGILIMSKHYDLIGHVYGGQMIGFCN